MDIENVSDEGQPSNFLERVRLANEARSAGKEDLSDAADLGEVDDTTVKAEDVQEEGSTDDTVEVNPLQSSAAKEPKKEKKSKEENLKNMREALKTERTRITTLESELEEANVKLSKLKDIEALQAELQEKTARIQELEKVEDLMGLKQSREFKERYIDGPDRLVKDALAIAKEYDVPAAVIKKAIETGNRRQLNELLSQHFDSIAVGDIRPIILETQRLLIEKVQAEKSPREATERLLQASEEREKAEQTKLRTEMSYTVQSGWDDMYEIYTNKNTGVEILREKSGDEEHNTLRKNILEKASQNYATTMGILVKNGLKNITGELAQAFAARFQLAEVAGHLIGENQALRDKIGELEKKVKSTTSYSRPLSTSRNSTGTPRSKDSEDVPSGSIASHVMQKAREALANEKS